MDKDDRILKIQKKAIAYLKGRKNNKIKTNFVREYLLKIHKKTTLPDISR